MLKQASPFVFAYYQDCVAARGAPATIAKPADIWRHVEFGDELQIARRAYGDKGVYVSVSCECDWEDEHGLQLVFKNGLVVNKVGAYDGHLTNSDAFADPRYEDVVYVDREEVKRRIAARQEKAGEAAEGGKSEVVEEADEIQASEVVEEADEIQASEVVEEADEIQASEVVEEVEAVALRRSGGGAAAQRRDRTRRASSSAPRAPDLHGGADRVRVRAGRKPPARGRRAQARLERRPREVGAEYRRGRHHPSFSTSMTSVPSACRSGASFNWRSTQLFILADATR